MTTNLLPIDENADWGAAAPGTTLTICSSYDELVMALRPQRGVPV